MNSKFLDIWLQQSSWAPIVLTYPNGWQTIKNRKGGPIPLDSSHLSKAYDQHGDIVGKRFGKFTNYLMIDIDKGSQYHPANTDPAAILDALKPIGLVEHIKIRSSRSEGIHLYFPLPSPVKSWALANVVHGALTKANVKIVGGVCELFPNKKTWAPNQRTEYNGHRLPLQHGSCMLGPDWLPISDSQEDFVTLWDVAAALNTFQELTPSFTPNKSKQPPLPKFTSPCQTNNILAQLANYGRAHLSLTTVPALAKWMKQTVVTLAGYQQYCSGASRADIAKNWCERWAKSCLKSNRIYKAKKQGPSHNQALADDAISRLKKCLARIHGEQFPSIRKLWARLREVGKELFDCGIGWTTFKKAKNLWQHLTLNTTPQPAHTVINKEGMCSYTEQGSEGVTRGVKKDQELKAGDRVRVWLPGCPDHGLETVVKSKQHDACGRRVYRLGERLAGKLMELPKECLQALA